MNVRRLKTWKRMDTLRRLNSSNAKWSTIPKTTLQLLFTQVPSALAEDRRSRSVSLKMKSATLLILPNLLTTTSSMAMVTSCSFHMLSSKRLTMLAPAFPAKWSRRKTKTKTETIIKMMKRRNLKSPKCANSYTKDLQSARRPTDSTMVTRTTMGTKTSLPKKLLCVTLSSLFNLVPTMKMVKSRLVEGLPDLVNPLPLEARSLL
mmetsp:Transcript_21372/g.30228  ORF Transcript_21372/g.30228 Transcript_21372/m.30228 type:complete len:205 (+) Transcript_21372:553-1167(+)